MNAIISRLKGRALLARSGLGDLQVALERSQRASPLVPVIVPTDQELRDFTRVKFISSHVGEAVWSHWAWREWSKVLGHDEKSCQRLFQVMRAAEESGQIVWESDEQQYRRGGVKGREIAS